MAPKGVRGKRLCLRGCAADKLLHEHGRVVREGTRDEDLLDEGQGDHETQTREEVEEEL